MNKCLSEYDNSLKCKECNYITACQTMQTLDNHNLLQLLTEKILIEERIKQEISNIVKNKYCEVC